MFYKSYKIRLFPTKEQEEMFYKHIGCCRVVWNFMLNAQIKTHNEEGKYLSEFGMINILPKLKKDENYLWLSEVSNRGSFQVNLNILNIRLKRKVRKLFQ